MKLKEFKQVLARMSGENDELEVTIVQYDSGGVIHRPLAGWAITIDGEFVIGDKLAMNFIINDIGEKYNE
jgi:hypothetical protein